MFLDRNTIPFVCIVFLWSTYYGNSYLFTTPRNVVSQINTDVTFSCCSNTSNRIQWIYRAPGSENSHKIFTGYNLNPVFGNRYNVSPNKNNHSVLRISGTQITDAGRYTCEETGTVIAASSELTILSTDTVCLSNLDQSNNFSIEELNRIELSCSLNYSGNWAPVMTWQQDGGPVITDDVVNNTVAYKSVTYSLTVLATRNLTGSKYTCITSFQDTNKPNYTIASNIPNYTYIWSLSQGINVVFAPTNMRITPRQSSYRLGDRLTCTADGNPQPTFFWKDLINGGTYEGPVLTVLISKHSNFKCTAANYISGKKVTDSVVIAFDITDDRTVRIYYITGGIAGVIILLIILFIGVFAFYRRRSRDNEMRIEIATHQTELEPVYQEPVGLPSYERINQETRSIPSVYTDLNKRRADIDETASRNDNIRHNHVIDRSDVTPPSSSESSAGGYINC